MICLVLLQDCVGFVGGETGYCSESCVTLDGDGTGEDCVKFEDPLHIKDEISQAASFPETETEHEVRFWGVCECVCECVCVNRSSTHRFS
jgi:hypothetical protein